MRATIKWLLTFSYDAKRRMWYWKQIQLASHHVTFNGSCFICQSHLLSSMCIPSLVGPMCFSENASFLTPDWIIEATYSPSARSEEYPPKIHSTEVKGNNMSNFFCRILHKKKKKKTADAAKKIAGQEDVRDPRSFSIPSSCRQQDSQFHLRPDVVSNASLSTFFPVMWRSSNICLSGFLTNEPLVSAHAG